MLLMPYAFAIIILIAAADIFRLIIFSPPFTLPMLTIRLILLRHALMPLRY